MLKAQIIGNLGGDPEMKYSANGQPYVRFNVASNYRTRDRDGDWQDATEWVRVTVFGQRAETLNEYLRKGARVYCDGRLEARPWAGERDDVLHAGLEMMANDVQFMSSRSDDDQPHQQRSNGNGGGQRQQQPRQQQTATQNSRPKQNTREALGLDDDDDEDLPF